MDANSVKSTTGKSEMETVMETIPSFEEVTITKTEVKEEPFDYETTDATELWVEVKEEVAPPNCVEKLADKTNDLKNYDFIKKEEPNKATFASNFCRNWKEQLAKKLKTGPGVGVCSLCKMEFFDEKSFGEHLATCKNISRLNQTGSTKSVDNFTQKNLPGHSKEKKFSCPNCARSFHHNFSLTWHINMIHLDERKHKCDSCNYATVFEHLLENHVSAMHSNVNGGKEKKYKCKICDYSSMFKGSFVLHMRSHSDDKPYKCTLRICKCGVSRKGKPCKCDKCNFASAHKQALKRHVFLKHTDSTKKYKCTYKKCRFVTTRECNLRGHVLARHSNEEKRYKCGKCRYLAYRKESLVKHFRKRHVREDLPGTSN